MMSLTIGGTGTGSGGGGGILHSSTTRKTSSTRRPILFKPNPSGFRLPLSPRTSHIVAAAKKLSSRTGRFDSKNRKSSITTTKEQLQEEQQRTAEIETGDSDGGTGAVDVIEDGYFLPELPGDKPDFWEGTQWDAFGFFVQYMWAFGIAFALIACGVAVATYNEGATDFKKTPVYKESIQSRELLEEPEGSNSDVFESNPTEEAPSLE